MTFPEFIAHVPVEVKPSNDGPNFYACGVWVQETNKPHFLPDRLSWQIEDALKAKAAAEGVNMPVALDPRRVAAQVPTLPSAVHRPAHRENVFRRLPNGGQAGRYPPGQRQAGRASGRGQRCADLSLPPLRRASASAPVHQAILLDWMSGRRAPGSASTYVVEWPDIGETPESEWRAWGAEYVAGLDRRIADMTSMLGVMKIIGFPGRRAAVRPCLSSQKRSRPNGPSWIWTSHPPPCLLSGKDRAALVGGLVL